MTPSLPPQIKTTCRYVGIVLTPLHNFILAMTEIGQSPTVNDLAKLLANAMRRPLVNEDHRPRAIHLTSNKKWEPLFPSLKQLGIELIVKGKLPAIDEESAEFVRQMRKERSTVTAKVTAEQSIAVAAFPAVAE